MGETGRGGMRGEVGGELLGGRGKGSEEGGRRRIR